MKRHHHSHAEITDLSPFYCIFEQGIIKAERPFDPTLAADPLVIKMILKN